MDSPSTRMKKARDGLTQRILDLTLEMIFLLTGEDHVVVKIHEMDNSSHQIPGGYRRTQSFNMEPPPHSGIHDRHNDQKILELTHRILRLLTGEVPIRCEDVTVHLSMEEWEYVERHKELYKDIMMEDHQPVITVDKSESGEFHSVFFLPDIGTKNRSGNKTNDVEKSLYTARNGRVESATCIEEESLALEERHIPTIDRSKTGYPPPDIKEEPALWKEGNLTDSDVYKPPEHTQTEYTFIYSKESNSHGEGNLTDPDIYPTIEDRPGNFEEYLKGNENTFEINSSESLSGSRKLDKGTYHHADVSPVLITRNSVTSSETGKALHSESNLVPHETNRRGEQFVVSDLAGNFSPNSDLKHQKVRTGEQPFSCSECGNCFTFASYFQIHTGEKPFKCTECGKCFVQASHLAAHKMIHTREKPYKCPDCGKCFSWFARLTSHKRIHSGEKPFSCSECGKSFSLKTSLIRHEKTHTGEKPFSCSECGKCFSIRSSLIRHVKTHTGEKPFKCTECGKCFTQATHLTQHKMIHTGEKPFKCTECGKCFSLKMRLNRHQRNHAREKTS